MIALEHGAMKICATRLLCDDPAPCHLTMAAIILVNTTTFADAEWRKELVFTWVLVWSDL
jgi:hypothetical protein